MSKTRIYLAGPINDCTDEEACNWREWFIRQTAFDCVDPMVRDYRGREHESYREIVELDKRDIRSVDIVVVMFIKPSVGTSMEVLFAFTEGIPVIVIDESAKPVSPWLRYHTTAIVSSKAECVEKINEWMSR